MGRSINGLGVVGVGRVKKVGSKVSMSNLGSSKGESWWWRCLGISCR